MPCVEPYNCLYLVPFPTLPLLSIHERSFPSNSSISHPLCVGTHQRMGNIFLFFSVMSLYVFLQQRDLLFCLIIICFCQQKDGTDKWEGKAIWCKNATGRSYQLRFSWSRPSKNHPSIAMGNTTKYIHFILLRMDWLGLA